MDTEKRNKSVEKNVTICILLIKPLDVLTDKPITGLLPRLFVPTLGNQNIAP